MMPTPPVGRLSVIADTSHHEIESNGPAVAVTIFIDSAVGTVDWIERT
jgi:hypothetical protein